MQKSLTTALFCKLLQLAAKKKVCHNCPARLASVGNETTHVQLRQSKLQTLQTFVQQQWQVCRSQKLLTAVLFRKFMRTPAKWNVRRNCAARLAPVGNDATHVQLRQSKLQPLQTLVHQQWEVCKSQKLLTAVLFRKLMRTAAKGEAYSNRPACLASVGKRETRKGLAALCCCNLCKHLCINSGKFVGRRSC